MTNQPQTELDEILANCFYKLDKHIVDEHPDPDLTEPCKYGDDLRDEAKQSLLDWHNKQVEEVLDRLESMAAYDPSGSSPVINLMQIEAERNKLKESTDGAANQ